MTQNQIRYAAKIGLTVIRSKPDASINEPIVSVGTVRQEQAYELPNLDDIVGITGMQEVDEQIYAVH